MNYFLRSFFAVLTSLILLFSGGFYSRSEPEFQEPPVPSEKQVIEQGEYNLKQYDLVVSPDGSDSFSGRLAEVNAERSDGPLKTITAAKQKMREYKSEGVECGDVTVWLRGGRYEITDTIVFTSDDLPNVTFAAYPGEKPVISGGRPVSEWTEETVNNVPVWTSFVEGRFNSLYNENEMLPRTRFPEKGYFKVKAQNSAGAAYTEETTPWSLTLGERAFDAKKSDLQDFNSFRNITDITVRVLHYWKDEIMGVERYDEDTGTVYCNKFASMIIKKGDRYFFENVFEALNEPGEWYHDSISGKLYYVPKAGEDINSTTLYAGCVEKLFDIDGVSGISFRGLTLRDTDWHVLLPDELMTDNGWSCKGMEHPQAAFNTPAAILIKNAENIVFDACNIINIGFSGIKLFRNVQNSSVTRCLFQNIGANAVFIHGDNAQNDNTNTNINVVDNHIYKYGRQNANAIGVLLVNANHCKISNNEIHDGYYTAISVGWVWGYSFNVTDYLEICDNLIYDIGQGWLSDMGGIYTLGIQPLTVIRGNVIHNVAADEGEGGYGGWGIYLDEGSSGILVEKNLAYFCGSNGFHQHYGRENIVRNNIFALNSEGQVRVSRKEEHISAIFTSNIVVGDNSPMFCSVENGKFEDENNLYWDYTRSAFVLSSSSDRIKLSNRLYKCEMTLKGFYKEAVFRDPWFRNAKSADFTLALNSPALKTGFEPWNYRAAGTLSLIEAV